LAVDGDAGLAGKDTECSGFAAFLDCQPAGRYNKFNSALRLDGRPIAQGRRARMRRIRLGASVLDNSDLHLQRYLRLSIGGAAREALIAIFLDSHHRYITDEYVAAGQGSHVVARLQPLLQRAVDLRARGLILAHNHPSGSVRPSAADIAATRRIGVLAQAARVRLVDHLIVSGSDVFSMRHAGLL
jgi:DNA repair protein RadC